MNATFSASAERYFSFAKHKRLYLHLENDFSY